MSYVIQNFIKFNSNLILTPRLKFIIFLRNYKIFSYLLKHRYFVYNYKQFNFFFLFYKFFFKNIFIKFKQIISLTNLNYYKNNFSKSLIYWNLTHIVNVFEYDKFSLDKYVINFCNKKEYLAPVKTFSINLKNKFYKNLFYFILFYLSKNWLIIFKKFCFPTNFFFINYNFQLYKFFNGPFFKVYNS